MVGPRLLFSYNTLIHRHAKLSTDFIVVIHNHADVCAFFHILFREKTLFKPCNDDVVQLFWGQCKRIDRETQLFYGVCVAHQTVVRVDGDGQAIVDHFSKRVRFEPLGDQLGHCLQVTGETNFQGNSLG